MRVKALFLLLAVIPLVLPGVNPGKLSEPSSRFQSEILSSAYSQPAPAWPVNGTELDGRSYRMTEYLLQKDEYMNGNLQNDTKYVYYYVDDNSDRIDSLRVYEWDENSSDWLYFYSLDYVYDETGEYPTARIFTDYQINLSKDYFYYDNQHRLSRLDRYFFYTSGDSVRWESLYYQYGADRLEQMNHYCLWWAAVASNMYERYVYAHDEQGRIADYELYSSADSLDYAIYSLTEIAYHPDDNSTGADYIQYLSHGMGNNLFWQKDAFGKLTEITTYLDQEAETWTNVTRQVFDYDVNGCYAYVTNQYYNIVWYNNYHYQYTYVNNYPEQVIKQDWNNSNSTWSIPRQIVTYTWEQYTGTEDDILPEITFLLSAYPNPFASSVNIVLQSKSISPVKAEVYNIKGQLIKALSGSKALTWDGTDSDNNPVSNGIYFIKAEQDGRAVTSKVIRMK